MERNKIDDKYKWNLEILFSTKDDVVKAKLETKEKIDKLAQFKGTLKSQDVILQFFNLKEKTDKSLEKLYLYASLLYSTNTSCAEYIKLQDELNKLLTYYSVKLSFVSPELAKIPNELLDKMISNKDFKNLDRVLLGIKRDKKHTLNTSKEKMLAELEEFSDFYGIFSSVTDAEMKFEPIITKDGRELPLTQSSYGVFIKDKDRDIRKQANDKLLKEYKKVNITLSNNYLNYVKYCKFKSNTYKFKSMLDMALFYDEVEKSVYNKILKSIHKNIDKFQKYLKIKANLLKVKDFSNYDISVPVSNSSKYSMEYENAVKIVKESVSILGKEYEDIVNRMFSERWVDVFPSDAKMNGAYSTSANTGNPYMLLNYEPIYRNISTIAHELGHSVHSYLSEKYQPYFKSTYTLFVAEIVSITNEILLANHIIKTETDENAKKAVLDGLIFEFNNNVFYAGMEAELEAFCHTAIDNEQSITYEDINNKYEQLLKMYYGPIVKISEYSKYAWARHSQFYNSYYLFKYAFGFLIAANIVKKIEKEGKDYIQNKYLKFLKAGSSDNPVNLLKLADIDITKEETYAQGFAFYEELLDLLTK